GRLFLRARGRFLCSWLFRRRLFYRRLVVVSDLLRVVLLFTQVFFQRLLSDGRRRHQISAEGNKSRPEQHRQNQKNDETTFHSAPLYTKTTHAAGSRGKGLFSRHAQFLPSAADKRVRANESLKPKN